MPRSLLTMPSLDLRLPNGHAMKAEIDQLECLKAWEVVDAPAGANITNSNFVFTRKRIATGQVSSYKAIFIGKGYSQVYGLDYFETFAPIVKMASQRIVFSTVSSHMSPHDGRTCTDSFSISARPSSRTQTSAAPP
jgi:hypothetical protein